MLGLIFGRNWGLACVEATLGRFRLDIDDLDGSDLFGTGPLGDGMATVRGLIATDAGVRSAADRGSKDGVPCAEKTGLAVLVRRLVSMRLTLGRGCTAGVAASGRAMSSMISSCTSSCAWPVN
jgi:hypothetical protein